MDYTKASKSVILHTCEKCDFICSRVSDYTRHKLTAKHKRIDIGLQQSVNKASTNVILQNNKQYICDCGMVYKYRQGLHKHHKTCLKPDNNIDIDSLTDKQLIMKLLQENTEMRKALVETCNKIQPSTINNNIQTNSNNKFNLQFFLNETCKDALNINDFVSSIQLQLTDLETTGRVGYVEGISKIIVHNLNNMEQYRRPVHCSDLKREIMYIKDNDEWTKEDTEKPLLTRAIKIIANENIKKINEWKLKNPDCVYSDSKKNNVYLNIVSNAMSGCTQEETNKNIEKIISNIVKETQIEK
jgi:hypothetical protein